MPDKCTIVVVDGGGSGCRLGAFDADGALLFTAVDGPASLTLGEDQAWQHIQQGLKKLATQLGYSSAWLPSRLYMGLAGALQSGPRTRFMQMLPSSIDAVLVTDGHAQLLGATGGAPSVCLAVGTGSVVHWKDETGNMNMAGGWGFPAGDEGSGAWLGSRLINAYLWHRDSQQTHNKQPPIFKHLEQRIGTNVSQIQAWSTQKLSTELASLAPIVVSFASKGDQLAESLLESGTNYCQKLIGMAPDTLPIYIVGGLGHVYRARLKHNLKVRCKNTHGNAMSGLYSLTKLTPESGL